MARLGSLRIGLEGALQVAKEDRDGATLDEHIRVMGLLWIKKTERHRGQIGSGAREMRTKEETRMGRIVARQVNDLDLAVIVDGDEMGRLATLLLAHKGIGLEGAWSPILPIIKGRVCPTDKGLRTNNEQKHQAHAQTHNGCQRARPMSQEH